MPEGSGVERGDESYGDLHAPQRSEATRAERTVAVCSLGCRANQEEIECLLGGLRDRGYRLVPFGAPADLTIVNTCGVTRAGESDARQMIRRAARTRREGRVVVTGCYAQLAPEEAARLGADLVVGNADKWRLPEILASAEDDPRGCAGILFDPDPTASRLGRHGKSASGYRTRAAIKVQDGCDERCTYCVIPALRGRGVSRDPAEVVDEARTLVEAGHEEITLTGIHTASYAGIGEGERVSLAGLLRRLLAVPGLGRIRLNSLEPRWVDDELLQTIAGSPRFCRHLHLPLQSGDAAILKRMGRPYGPHDYRRVVEAARRAIPGVAIGADVMVGFPGESEEAFGRTLRLLEEVRPAYLHIFGYSERPRTSASRLGDPVPRGVAKDRSRALSILDDGLRRDYLKRSDGEFHEIRIEGSARRGRPAQGVTDTYIRVSVEGRFPDGERVGVILRYVDDPRRMAGEIQSGRPPGGDPGAGA